MSINILIIDDDVRFSRAVQLNLQDTYNIFTAVDFNQAINILNNTTISLILLDFMVGNHTGHSILDELRNYNFFQPIIVLSGAVDLQMTTGFLKRTVQGFFEKPFLIQDLRLKINEVLNSRFQHNLPLEINCKRELQSVTVNPNNRSVNLGNKTVVLTKTEFQIFRLFMLKPLTKITREELIYEIWGQAQHSKNNLDTHLLNLRKKLPEFSKHLQLVYGEGYYFSPKNEWLNLKFSNCRNPLDHSLQVI